ncbi:MAG: ATP-dependent helicase [Eubacteriales bacterium]|nr:ATP-dependent helicase [Eubacteriales bacterium]
MIKRNPAQQRAISHLSGPMMVLAGPGSGKTSVIVERIEYLVRQAKISPSSILVVTFSKAAAGEMKERFLKRVENRVQGVTFGTFHGVFYGILKQAYHLGASNILSEEQKYGFLRRLLEKYGDQELAQGECVEEIAREISTIKGNRISLEHYYSTSCPDEVFRKIYCGYEAMCRKNRLLDFDDMLVCCYELLSEREDIRRAWQRKFQYILVDEFQDINQIQYDTIRLLAQPQNNLFIVGDDDQSIYHFRGARPEIMLNFPKDYPEGETVLLNINYRCSRNVLESAVRLIGHNKKRYQKELSTPNAYGQEVRIICLPNLREESLFVIRELEEYRNSGKRLEDTAILFRTNLEAEGLVGLCMEYQLSFCMKERLPNLFEHWIAEDILAYLRMAQGDMSRGLFLRVMNRPNRFLSREAVFEEQISWKSLFDFYREKDWMCDRLITMRTHLGILKSLNPFAAVNFIRHGIGYEEYLQEYAVYRKIKPEELLDILERVQESARGMQNLEQWQAYIRSYGEKLKEQFRAQQANPKGTLISTLHSVKGLEYDRVYILNVNEGNIPYKKAVLEAQLEEERRLFYVGMTRAKKELILCHVARQFDKEKEASRFLEEVQKT